jgi:hypothetical protein
MNRIKRIAAATAISTAVLIPVAAAVADAEPTAQTQAEQLLRQEQRYMQQPVDEQLLRQEQQYIQEQTWPEPADEASASETTTGFPWETVGLSALGAGVLAAGGVVLVRQYHHEPHPVSST